MNLLLPEGLWGYGIQSNRIYKEFKRDDRIILTHSYKNPSNVGATGAIISGDGNCFTVKWDKEYPGLNNSTGITPSRIDLLNSKKQYRN